MDYKRSPDHADSIHTCSPNYWTRGNNNEIVCENCFKQQGAHQLSEAQIPVTLQLLQRAASDDEKWSAINHLVQDHVVEYLKDRLHRRVVAVNFPRFLPPVVMRQLATDNSRFLVS